jgi:hypothetical protein
MTPPTSWPARRVGDRILCDRPSAPRCRGEIATVVTGAGSGEPGVSWFVLPFGFKEEPKGSHVWIPRVRTRSRSGRPWPEPALTGSERKATSYTGPWPTEAPFWRRCPICNVLAEVTADLLK